MSVGHNFPGWRFFLGLQMLALDMKKINITSLFLPIVTLILFVKVIVASGVGISFLKSMPYPVKIFFAQIIWYLLNETHFQNSFWCFLKK